MSLDEVSKAVIESYSRLYETFIKNNKELSYMDVALLRSRHDQAMSVFGPRDRVKYIYLGGDDDASNIYRFTILDDEFIIAIQSNIFDWDEKINSYKPLYQVDKYDAFVIRSISGDIAYAGGYDINQIKFAILYSSEADTPEESIFEAIDEGVFGGWMIEGSIVYPVGLNLRYNGFASEYARDFNELSTLLYVLSKFGYWNMATIHMMEYNPLSDLKEGRPDYAMKIIEGLETGEFSYRSFSIDLMIEMKINVNTGEVRILYNSDIPINVISPNEFEWKLFGRYLEYSDQGLSYIVREMQELGMTFPRQN